MENNNINNSQQNKKNKGGLLRTSLICIIGIVFVILLFWLFTSNTQGKQVSHDQFYQALENNQITQVEFSSEKVSFKYANGEWNWFYHVNGVTDNVYAEVIEYNKTATTDIKISTLKTSTFNVLSLIFPILLVISMFLLVRFVAKQIRGINSKGTEFTKNRARISESTVKFDKVAGADEEKQELEEIIQFLKDPKKFTEIGARIPKGVLLVGPPGTGKTLLAKAVAGEANVPFFTISGSDFMELYVGVGASRVRDLFETAKKAKPCIIFIDEIDAVGRQRGTGLGGGNDEREQTLNQLLVQMDGFEVNEGIIIMAATNRADILDPALIRPGRFDRQVYINRPDVKGREEILKVHAVNKPLDKDVKLKEIARVTSGFTGADLENLLNEAAILAARNNKKTISMEDLNNSIVKVSIGPQKRSRVVTERDNKITAFHESGHAVVEKCVKNSDPVHEVSIVQRGGAAGYTISRPDNDDRHMTKQKLIDNITMTLGGRAAEELFLDDITTGASNDILQATNIAKKMVTEWGMSSEIGLVCLGEVNELFLGRDFQNRATYSEQEASLIDKEVKSIITECYKKAKEILQNNKDKVQTMVDVLLEKETIYSDEVDMIMNGDSKEKIIEFIENKYKAKEKQKEEIKKEEVKDIIKENEKFVDSLLKKAEERARLKKEESSESGEIAVEKTTEDIEKKQSESVKKTKKD